MRKGILQALFMLAGGPLLISFIAVTAALLVARIGTSSIAESLAPPVAMAANDALETRDAVGAMGYPVSRSTTTINHGNVVFERWNSPGGSWDIFLTDGQTGQVRQMTTNRRDDRFPALSPDGKSIAFVSWRDGNSEIYIIDIESGILHNISKHSAHDSLPAWSPDGSTLAFVSDRIRREGLSVYLADVDRGLLYHLTHSPLHDARSHDDHAMRFRPHHSGRWDEYLLMLDGLR